jgi:glycogen debranching enzyme
MKILTLSVFIVMIFLTGYGFEHSSNARLIDQLRIDVKPDENREFAFTDKESAYFYGRTHSYGTDFFSGWNVKTERIFQDYQLRLDGRLVDRKQSSAKVFPHYLKRIYTDLDETFRMFDEHRVLSIQIDRIKNKKIGISLYGPRIQFLKATKNIVFYKIDELPNHLIAISTIKGGTIFQREHDNTLFFESAPDQDGFFIALDYSEATVCELIRQAQLNHSTWTAKRERRMEDLLRNNQFRSSLPELDHAIHWNILSLDALVTKQTGYGIYAGLPWFNDYWGRDMFISLPGACLVTGQFDIARKILLSFSQYQNKDENSSYFGRVPNRVRPDEIIYNTTDGTPRFIIALFNYIQYSGDITLIDTLYPVVQRSIDGPLKYWVDEKGYLTHDDADTWMDAKKDGKVPFSPRGNRANDIQALWYHQLQAGIYFARFMKKEKDEKLWTETAERMRANFIKDFMDSNHELMADRLFKDGKPDFTLRPNQLFAFDLLFDKSEKFKLTRKVWENLVYPWGVASLSQNDPGFHPWHEHWDFYHKDEAYHNGTVWLWNNGIAMQRMLEAGQSEPAFQLFRNMSRQTLHDGAVGCLSELTDALPREGKNWPKLSGTFSQAWSSAEYLRIWYQFFLGIRPSAIEKRLVLNPLIPDQFSNLNFKSTLFNGTLLCDFKKIKNLEAYNYLFDHLKSDISVQFNYPEYSPISFSIGSKESFRVLIKNDLLLLEIYDSAGEIRFCKSQSRDTDSVAVLKMDNQIFNNLSFAKPYLNSGLKALKK